MRIELDDFMVDRLNRWKKEALENASIGNEIVISEEIYRRLQHPRADRPSPNSRCYNMTEGVRELSEAVLVCDYLGAEQLRNVLVFQPGNVLHWHTNSNVPGTRVYYIYNEKAGSIFSYKDEHGNIIHDEEPEGWVARRFVIPEEGLLWHAVWAKGHRISIGFLMKEGNEDGE